MGYDLFGLDPKSEVGEYFRNNIWWWPGLWRFVCGVCEDILSKEDMEKGHWNAGHIIGREKAGAIADRLREVLQEKDQHAERVIGAVSARHIVGEKIGQALSEVTCKDGKAELKPNHPTYHFDWENVREFTEFCKDSGGFRIC